MVASAHRFASSLRLVLDLNLSYVGYSPADKGITLMLPVDMDQTVTPSNDSWTVIIDGSNRNVVDFRWLAPNVCEVLHDGDIMETDGSLRYIAWDDGFRALDGRLVHPSQFFSFAPL